MEDKAATATEEEELARWAAAAGGASSAGTEAPLVEDVTGDSSEEEAETAGLTPAMGRGRVLRWPVPASRSSLAGLRGHS